MTVRIRRAEPDDAAGMVAILNPIIAAGTLTSIDAMSTERSQREFIESLPSGAVFNVAEDTEHGALVGMQDVLPIEGRVGAGDISTFVRLDIVGRGVGRALAAETIRQAAESGYDVLRAVIRSDNGRAIAFYRSLGFEDAAGGGGSSIVLEKTLARDTSSVTLTT